MKHIYFFIILYCGSCASSLSPQTDGRDRLKGALNTKPDWLSSKPYQNGYYTGIGSARKSMDGNYIQAAKKSALQDLVSEIRVSISSSSVLNQIELNFELQEEYRSEIQTTAADEITEFELVEAWEDDNVYWVYYRLSKLKYRLQKEQERNNAISLARDFYEKGKEANRAYKSVNALSFYLKGLKQLEKYLGEAVTVEYSGQEVLLGNELLASIQQVLKKIRIDTEEEQYEVNRRNISGLSIPARVFNLESGDPLVNIPVKTYFEKGFGALHGDYTTDEDGEIKVIIDRFGSKAAQQSIRIELDLYTLSGIAEEEKGIYHFLIDRLIIPGENVVFKIRQPSVFLSAKELSLGNPKTNSQLANKIKSLMSEAGFTFTKDKDHADLWMDVNANTEQGPVSGSIYITYLTMQVKVTDASSMREIYSGGLDGIKGYSLSFERSSQEAYNQSLELLEEKKAREIIEAALH